MKTHPHTTEADALRQFKADMFQALANPLRIQIIECLKQGELSVGQLLSLMKVEPSNLSQHLASLRLKKIVVSRKSANQVFYSLRDPLLMEVLDTMRRLFQLHLEESRAMLQNMEQEVS